MGQVRDYGLERREIQAINSAFHTAAFMSPAPSAWHNTGMARMLAKWDLVEVYLDDQPVRSVTKETF